MGRELNVSIKYASGLTVAEVVADINMLIKGIVIDDTTRKIISIKHCKLEALSSLKSIIEEISNCIVIGANQAAITLTNHLLENLLKQSLITWDSGGKMFNDNERIDETFRGLIEEHGNTVLWANIDKCKDRGLIDEAEADNLKYLKNKYRNSFSHASYSEMLKGDTMTFYKGSFASPLDITKEKNIQTGYVPGVQQERQRQFAQINATGYLFEVYSYAEKFEEKLRTLYNNTKQ